MMGPQLTASVDFTIRDAWPILLAALSFIVWLVRLEGKATSSEKKIDILETKHDSLNSAVAKELSSVKQSLARIEGALGLPKQGE